MFFDCLNAVDIWEQIDQLGHEQWDTYVSLDRNEIPTVITEYDPIKLLHLCTLWAMWVHWCKYYHQPDEFSEDDLNYWINIVILATRDQLRMRMQESFSAVQWLHIVADRRIHSSDKLAEVSAEAKAPEKEFLLIHSQNINTNSENISINGRVPLEILKWFGNGYLIKADGASGVNPRMVFNYHPWDPYTRPPDVDYPSDYDADDWRIMPRHYLMDY